MLFTSPIFLFAFLPLLLATYYLLPGSLHVKNGVALAASVLFFAWGEPIFVYLLIVGIYIDYKASLVIAPDSPHNPRTKRWVLVGAICLNVAALVISKYLNFIVNEIINPLSPWSHWHVQPPNFPLLLGISFITFHRISYLVDSYKGRAVPPRGFLDCALYIFLFPQLIAGPIIRYHDIGHQIHDRTHTLEKFLTGFFRFSVGLMKKTLIADPLGVVTDKVFGLPTHDLTSLIAWGGIIAYTLQIYFDFSGYSDMAIGLGRMLGFVFPENFNRPYISRSVTEFWRRWHISLSNWMRLYLYIPLGGNRISLPRTYLNLWIVFTISGIWHGASWNFVAWGAYYGFFLCIERMLSNSRFANVNVMGSVRHLYTLLLVMIGWVLFRSPSMTQAVAYLSAMFIPQSVTSLTTPPWGLLFGNRDLATMLLGSVIACVRWPEPRWSVARSLKAAWAGKMSMSGAGEMTIQFATSLGMFILSVAANVSSDYSPFLYFRF
jgi:alginate O-acetyltransferase complex protein AlgI